MLKLWRYREIGEPRIVNDVFEVPSLDPDYLGVIRNHPVFLSLPPKEQEDLVRQFEEQCRYAVESATAEPDYDNTLKRGEDRPKVIGRDV